MSQSGLQDFRVDSFTDRQSSVGVSQVVDSHRFTHRHCHRRLSRSAAKVADAEAVSVGGGEHQVRAGVVDEVCGEQVDEGLRDGEGASRSGGLW